MTKSNDIETPPLAGDIAAGFTQTRLGNFGGSGLFVPLQLAASIQAEAKAKREAEGREKAKLDAESAVGFEEQEERKSVLKGARTPIKAPNMVIEIGEHQPAPQEVARHRVLVDVEAVLALAKRVKSGAVRGDAGDTRRETAALSAALERGADRSIVRPLQWPRMLDDLIQELPAFRGPINLVSQAFALAEHSGCLPALPPMLLLGPPGVGKSHFARRLAEVLDSGHAWLAFDQRSAGTSLRGSDSHWGNTRHGLLFEHLALGSKGTANPLFVVDEIDKASESNSSANGTISMSAQLLSLLEPETARHVEDISLHVELDASQVMWVATANDLQRIETPLLSRFEVFQIGRPNPAERREAARRMIDSIVCRLGFGGNAGTRALTVTGGVHVLLADYSPRVIRRAMERALAITVGAGRDRVTVDDVERALGIASVERRSEDASTQHLH